MSMHYRRCWDCGNVAVHTDSVTPEVLCKRTGCRSQDTRIVLLKTCPFCGSLPFISFRDVDGVRYFSIGCGQRDCFAADQGQMAMDQLENFRTRVESWNRRATP